MKICLIYPPSGLPPSLTLGTVPLGIYKVGTMLQEHGFCVTLLDQYSFLRYLENGEKASKEKFMQDPVLTKALASSDILGFSVDSYNYGSAKMIISVAREINPDLKIIMGGVHPTLLDEYVAGTSGADVILRGEAEERIVPLVSLLHQRRPIASIPGITYRDADGSLVRNEDAPLAPAETLAAVSHIDYRMISRLDKVRVLPVETSRGCLFRCRFCSILYKGKRRLFPVERVQHDLMEASKLKKEIIITDDCLTFEFRRAQEVLTFVNGLDSVAIHFESRASDLAKDDCQILSYINPEKVKFIQIGVECGYEAGLKKIRKGITTSQVEQSCKKVAQIGMERATLLSFIIGFPWEGMAECLKTIAFADHMRKDYGINAVINFWVPSPSEIWMEMKESGRAQDCMFDDPYWCFSDEIFSQTHPRISPQEKIKLQFLSQDVMGVRI